jgi:dephospho-CoA kinase
VLIGLTGGIGSGKSTVAKRLVELGATEIDADLLAREVVEPGSEGLAEVATRFGEDLVNQDGSLNRALLAERAFSSDANRKDLEAILHPRIQKLSRERIGGSSGVIVYTIPLLVETNSKLPFDKIVTVSAPEDIRVDRLVQSRGMTRAEAEARISAQATDEQREAIADFVVNSNCTMAELIEQVDALYLKVAQ